VSSRTFEIAAEGEASEVLELMIDYNEHLFVVCVDIDFIRGTHQLNYLQLPPELRDQCLVYHQAQDHEYAASIIRALIQHEQAPQQEIISDYYTATGWTAMQVRPSYAIVVDPPPPDDSAPSIIPFLASIQPRPCRSPIPHRCPLQSRCDRKALNQV